MSDSDPLSYFHLKPIRAARVSEISEATAAAPVQNEERVNFHIGNPLQDSRFSSAVLRVMVDIDVHQESLGDTKLDELLETLGWSTSDKPKLEFLIRMLRKCSPYMPRGGYSRQNPHALVKAFYSWLQHQQEPLNYDTGEQSARREMIIASGGTYEVLRIMLFVLSSYMEITPARILCYRLEFLPVIRNIPNLFFEDLSSNEHIALEQIVKFVENQPDLPTFVLIGGYLEERTRRKLRRLSLKRPLFFIEVNDAPNHLSLAREAKLEQRVIRLLTPAIFAPRLSNLSTVFVAGNADFLKVIESVHFNLKGTPSASEVELLIFLLEQKLTNLQESDFAVVPQNKPAIDGATLGFTAETTIPQLIERIEQRLDRLLSNREQILADYINHLEVKATKLSWQIQNSWKADIFDEFSAIEANDLLDLLIQNIHDQTWIQKLQFSFLSNFVKHQPHYKPTDCLIVSGSSRTALGIIGFHCGISEVVIPDLSWSYEQCFPKVHTIPLTELLELDVDGIIAKVEELIAHDASWKKRGAVVINNPHNATGRIFNQEAIRKLITYCLQHSIYVIDDLAYQNLAPVDDLPEIKTARQIATELVRFGNLNENQAARLITVHSVSKTDCLAGARLAVIEIRDLHVRERFDELNSQIQPNLGAIFICYLFYRGSTQATRTCWQLRNSIFRERIQALQIAEQNLPADRNPFGLNVIAPMGSMYPLLHIEKLPAGISLDWLASSLARRGIGLLPLATFARTEKGFETGRTSFRLTLGGVDNAEILLIKTRRLLIDLNRLIAAEEARYNRKQLSFRVLPDQSRRSYELSHSWEIITQRIQKYCEKYLHIRRAMSLPPLDSKVLYSEFVKYYLPERLNVFFSRLLDRALISDELVQKALNDNGEWLSNRLDREFNKDSLQRRQELFRFRSYDRTVHPTQMYSLQVEIAFDAIVSDLILHQQPDNSLIEKAAQELVNEFIGRNVSITSEDEASEIMLDLASLVMAEEFADLYLESSLFPFLSFWSDWDGSNRPSGQGHRIIAAVVMENVRRMAHILNNLRRTNPSISINPDLLIELKQLPEHNQRFTELLNKITLLTHQLEQRYRGILPFSVESTSLQRLATKLRLYRDPAQVLWQHNDRYERKMLELRQQRRKALEYYFSLNKQLRKQLHNLIPVIQNSRTSEILLREVVGFRDILQRVVITPRIHQGLITARDQFAIDTTIFNMNEINTLAGKYNNPGMTLAIQVSMSTKPDALVSLDRKMRNQREQMQREFPMIELPSIWIVPLMEDIDSVQNIQSYLDRIWEYATQSRHTLQSPQNRFAEIISEVFIAGSDLSQQVSQATGAFLYLKSKYDIQSWLAEHGVAEAVRIKLGSGEPMQRQGGYYSDVAGKPAVLDSEDTKRRISTQLPAAARKSMIYAVTPLQGVFLGGDLRTFQSNLSEKLRYLPVNDFTSLLYHVRESQIDHRDDLIRAAETITESRLSAKSWSLKELERLTIGTNEAFYDDFLDELTNNFRQILYGQEEDVIGIHAVSYFIGRSLPQLRDRPTSRRTPGTGADRGQQILANIAEIIPLARQGSLLRAIAHNQAQTIVLGVNQLTTGLFRALERFAQKSFAEAERDRMISELLLPHLPVYEVLSTLRIYHDWKGEFLDRIETAFSAGNSSLAALREDKDAMKRYLPLFQQELLRRHGVNVNDFFKNGYLIQNLLPTLRCDLAVLLQKDLFNTDINNMLDNVSGRIAGNWQMEVTKYLEMPRQVHYWRKIIWDLIGDSIYQRVQSFSELAIALYSFSSTRSFGSAPTMIRGTKLTPALAEYFRTAPADDEMRHFLIGTLEYLNSFAEANIEVPISIIRAMNDVERLAQIEESALPQEKQDIIRYCLLQIARITGENG